MRDEYDTTHLTFDMPSRSHLNMNELIFMQLLTECSSRRCFAVPPQMLNPAQFGNLIASAAQRELVNARRRCTACVVFLCLDGSKSWVWTTNPPRRGGPPCPPAQVSAAAWIHSAVWWLSAFQTTTRRGRPLRLPWLRYAIV